MSRVLSWTCVAALATAGMLSACTGDSNRSASPEDWSVVATIEVGLSPDRVAISPDGTRAYVTDRRDDTLHVIDTETNEVLKVVDLAEEDREGGSSENYPGGARPTSVAAAPDPGLVYVVTRDGRVLMVTPDSGEVVATNSSVSIPDPLGLAGVGTFAARDVTVLPQGVAYTVGQVRYYSGIPSERGDYRGEQVEQGALKAVAMRVDDGFLLPDQGEVVLIGGDAVALAAASDGDEIYVLSTKGDDDQNGIVSIVDISTGSPRVDTTVDVPGFPSDIEVSRDGRLAYVAILHDRVAVVDLERGEVVNERIGTEGIVDLAVSPDGKYALVPGFCFVGGGSGYRYFDGVMVVNLAQNEVVDTIEIAGDEPRVPTGAASVGWDVVGVVFSPDGLHAYVTGRYNYAGEANGPDDQPGAVIVLGS